MPLDHTLFGNPLSFVALLLSFRKRTTEDTVLKCIQLRPPHDSSSLTSLVCSSQSDNREDPFQCRSCPWALHFSSQGYFYPPSCRWVSAEHGAHRTGDLQGDFDWAWAAWYLSLGQGLPMCPLPLLPGRVCLGEAYWCQQLLGTTGDLTLDSALCTSKSVHLEPKPANSDWVLGLQT